MPVLRNFQIVTRMTKTHRKGCPLSKGSQQNQTHSFGIRTALTSNFFMKALEVSFGLNHGAGGYSLGSYFGLRTLLRNDSPAFQLFDWETCYMEKGSWKTDVAECVKYMEEALQKLTVWFSEGKASPNDINIDGKTILQASRSKTIKELAKRYQLAIDITDGVIFPIDESRAQSARKDLLVGLARIGVPLDHKDFDNRYKNLEHVMLLIQFDTLM